MTKEEIEKIFGYTEESNPQMIPAICCVYCKSKVTAVISTTDKPFLGKLYSFLNIVNQGKVFYSPQIYTYTTAHGAVEKRSLGPSIVSLEGMFCTKNCLVNFFFEHQHDMVELITQ